MHVLYRVKHSLLSPCRCPVLLEAVRVLDDPRRWERTPGLGLRASWGLIPYLVVTSSTPDSPEILLASYISHSSLLAQHPLTQGWSQGNASGQLFKRGMI